MRNKVLKLTLLTALISTPVYFLSCGTDSTNLSSDTAPKTASLTLGAKFKTTGVKSQFISQNTTCIEYSVYNYNDLVNTYPQLITQGTISPSTPQTTISNLPVGEVLLNLRMTNGSPSTDGTYCEGNTLDEIYPYVELAEGQNTFTATMVGNAEWTFVDSNDNPAPITLNKTNPNSQEQITSFDTFPVYLGISPTAIDTTKPPGGGAYKLLWKGSNLYTNTTNTTNSNNCVDDTKCVGYGIYILQLIGPNTTNNTFDSGDIPLAPYTDNNGVVWERHASIVGISPSYDTGYSGYYNQSNFSVTQSDGTDIIQDIETRFGYTSVIDANHMQGILMETAVNTSTVNESYTCAWDQQLTNTFTCPQQVKQMALKTAVINKLNSLDNGISSQAIDNNQCYQNVTVDESSVQEKRTGWYAQKNCGNVDINNDGTTEYVCDYNLDGTLDQNDDTNGDGVVNYNDSKPFYVSYSFSANMNICIHQFRAKAGEIPSGDLNLTLQ